MIKKVMAVIGMILALASVVGLLFSLDGRWAHSEDVERLAIRLEQKIQQDRARDLQQRQWTLEDRYGKEEKMPQSVREEYRGILAERSEILKSKSLSNLGK